MPVFKNFIENALFIQNQRLSLGHAVALFNGFQVIKKRNIPIKEVILHNNDMDDASHSAVVEGATLVARLRRFESIGNEMKNRSIYMLGQLILRPAPNKLKELKLTDCKISNFNMEKLLKILSKKCVLEELQIQNAFYNKEAVQYLCDLIDHAKFLKTIDISWCHIKEQQSTKYYIQILTALSENRKLNFINVSWNVFCGSLPGAYVSKEDLKAK